MPKLSPPSAILAGPSKGRMMAARYIPPMAAPFSPAEALPAAEWLADWQEACGYIAENIGEHEAQYRSECALFGDAGPGQDRKSTRLNSSH